MKHNALFQSQLLKVSPEVKKETEWAASIVDSIDRILREKGMTQRDLAAKIGCNETQIVRWTHGFPNYTLSTLAKLSVALGEDLISLESCPKRPSACVDGYGKKRYSRGQYLSEPSVGYRNYKSAEEDV